MYTIVNNTVVINAAKIAAANATQYVNYALILVDVADEFSTIYTGNTLQDVYNGLVEDETDEYITSVSSMLQFIVASELDVDNLEKVLVDCESGKVIACSKFAKYAIAQ